MQNLTKFNIHKPAKDVFEAFVDPTKIGNFWFTSSSERWESGKTITLIYKEYGAQIEIEVTEVVPNKKIVFQGGGHVVTISLEEREESVTIIEVKEEGFEENEDLIPQLLDNKEGWVFVLSCLKAYLEFGVNELRTGLVK
jgi:uncharacterized protein YndB with AHSA1/START domain